MGVPLPSEKEQREADKQQGLLRRAKESPAASLFLVPALPEVALLLSFTWKYSHLLSYNKGFQGCFSNLVGKVFIGHRLNRASSGACGNVPLETSFHPVAEKQPYQLQINSGMSRCPDTLGFTQIQDILTVVFFPEWYHRASWLHWNGRHLVQNHHIVSSHLDWAWCNLRTWDMDTR